MKTEIVNKIVDKTIYNYKVLKSNQLIESKSNFGVIEQRIILLALVQIKPSDTNLRTYKIPASDIVSQDSNYGKILSSIIKLKATTISIKKSKRSIIWDTYPLVTSAKITYASNKMKIIEIGFNKKVKRFLLGLKSNYTSYVLSNVIRFKNCYSLRIYELCKQFLYKGRRDISVEYFRFLLSLENKYSRFQNLKDWVINPAIKEITEYSDLSIVLLCSRVSEGMTTISFLITEKKIAPVSEARAEATATAGAEAKQNYQCPKNPGLDYQSIIDDIIKKSKFDS